MPNVAISSQGTLIQRQPFGTVGYVTIGELHDITPPKLTRKAIDTTSHNDPEESFVVGIRRKSDLTFVIGFVPSLASHDHLTGLTKSYIDGAKDSWKVIYPDASVWTFDGYIVDIGPSAKVDGDLTATVTVRPTGAMVFA
jgi:hypothetical protein